MKKSIAVIASVMLTAVVLAGCSGQGTQSSISSSALKTVSAKSEADSKAVSETEEASKVSKATGSSEASKATDSSEASKATGSSEASKTTGSSEVSEASETTGSSEASKTTGSSEVSKTTGSSEVSEVSKTTGSSEVSEVSETVSLPDGTYRVKFNTDSSMFHANEASEGFGTLNVENGEMTLHVSLASKGIVNLFPGTAEDAQKEGAVLLQPTTDTVTYKDGMTEEVYGFDIPVPAIGEEFDCALIGKKGVWYDHKVSVTDPEIMG